MARSAEGLKDFGACMVHSKGLSTVRWTSEDRGLQGMVSFACLLLPAAQAAQAICQGSTAQHHGCAGNRSHSRVVPGKLIGQIPGLLVAMFRNRRP